MVRQLEVTEPGAPVTVQVADDPQFVAATRGACPPGRVGESHWLRSVVLPNPAGAETSTSLGSSEAPERTSSVSLGRATSGRRVAGTWSFVPSTTTSAHLLDTLDGTSDVHHPGILATLALSGNTSATSARSTAMSMPKPRPPARAHVAPAGGFRTT
jgi:hypothetical protein